MDKKQLYESIMSSVAKEVKKVLNEEYVLDDEEYEDQDKELRKWANEYCNKNRDNIELRRHIFEYLDTYYRKFPEEKYNYPNWLELDLPQLSKLIMKAFSIGNNKMAAYADRMWKYYVERKKINPRENFKHYDEMFRH